MDDKTRTKRRNIIKELLDTEELYVRQLNLIVDLYLTPLDTGGIIKKQKVELIFSNIEQIRDVNEQFVKSLRDELNKAEDLAVAQVSPVFKPFTHFFKTYTEYVNNHALAAEEVQKLFDKNYRFKAFCKAAEDNEKSGGLDLEDLLITPVQRVPRYKLLLESLLKYTPDVFVDKKGIPQILGLIEEVASKINDAARESEFWIQILKLVKTFKDGDKIGLAIFGRRIVKIGKLTKQNARTSSREFTFFLFNDLLAYAHGGGTSLYVLHHAIPINSKFEVRDLPDHTEKPKNGIEILNTTKSFIVYAPDPIIKKDWLEALQRCIDEYKSGLEKQIAEEKVEEDGELAARWVDNDSSKICKICKLPFTIVRRKHHCRRCGQLVCGTCSAYRLKTKDKGEMRICDNCKPEVAPKKTSGKGIGLLGKKLSTISADTGAEAKFEEDGSDIEEEKSDDDRGDGSGFKIYSVAMPIKGEPSAYILGVLVGDRIVLLYEDPSGYWYCRNKRSGESGWVDPAVVGNYLGEEEVTLPKESGAASLDTISTGYSAPVSTGSLPRASRSSMKQIVFKSEAAKISRADLRMSMDRAHAASTEELERAKEKDEESELFKATMKFGGSEHELAFFVGDLIEIVEKDSSGFWYGINKRTEEDGWVDPSMLAKWVDPFSIKK